jgi:cell division transport system permease protein
MASLSVLNFAISLSARSASLYRIEAFFLNAPEPAVADSLLREVAEMEGVASLIFVSAEEALAEFKESFPEEMLYLIDGNPLPASFRIQVAVSAQNMASIQKMSNRLLALPEISEAQAPTKWIERWEGFKWHFFFIPIAVSTLMLCILWLIMWNAIRLTLISRKELVENIKYSGGTPFFIQFPFVLEGLLQGLAGAGLAAILYLALEKTISEYFSLLSTTQKTEIVLFVVLFVALSEAVISFVTTRKFLTRGI